MWPSCFPSPMAVARTYRPRRDRRAHQPVLVAQAKMCDDPDPARFRAAPIRMPRLCEIHRNVIPEWKRPGQRGESQSIRTHFHLRSSDEPRLRPVRRLFLPSNAWHTSRQKQDYRPLRRHNINDSRTIPIHSSLIFRFIRMSYDLKLASGAILAWWSASIGVSRAKPCKS
jgi:hypothetical protein